MSIGALGGAGAGAAAPGNKFAQMGSDEFVRIITTELANQDPLNPQDTSALLEQLSTLRNIESQVSLQDQLASLVEQNTFNAVSGLIGKTVTYEAGVDPTTGEPLLQSAEVKSVSLRDGEATLKLSNDVKLPLDKLRGIGGDELAALDAAGQSPGD